VVHGHGLALDLQDGLVGGRGEPYAMGDFFERGQRFFGVRADVAESIDGAVEDVVRARIGFRRSINAETAARPGPIAPRASSVLART
jgi:hypothetical protein